VLPLQKGPGEPAVHLGGLVHVRGIADTHVVQLNRGTRTTQDRRVRAGGTHGVLSQADTVHQCGDGDQARALLDQAEGLIDTVSSQRMVHRFEALWSAVS
jgi:hypothetical protein